MGLAALSTASASARFGREFAGDPRPAAAAVEATRTAHIELGLKNEPVIHHLDA
jgi:hypothetical protein